MDNILKYCPECSTLKNVSEFYKGNKYVDGFQYWCKKCALRNHNEFSENNRNNWKKYFKSKNLLPICEICGKKLKFFDGRLGVNFDHKKKDLLIKVSPSIWLGTHKVSKENIKIFESCNFGILCSECNNFLPTEDRERLMKGLVKYVFGKNLDSRI